MVKELIAFTESIGNSLDSDLKEITPGLHLYVDVDEEGKLFLSKIFDTKNEIETSEVEKISFYEKSSAYLSMNKQQKFDSAQKIHSANPFCFAFNFSLGNKKKEIEEAVNKKIENNKLENSFKIEIKNYKIEEVKKSISNYFINAKRLCLEEPNKYEEVLGKFEIFCKTELFDIIKYEDKEKNVFKERYESLGEKNYVKVYLVAVTNSEWKAAYQYYFESEYPQNKILVNDFFCATYNSKKTFLTHHTASFDTSYSMKGTDAAIIKSFEEIAKSKPKILPNPLPIFISKEELNKKVISIFKENEKFGYKEIIENLFQNNSEDLNNYYLLNWYFGKEFQVVDMDFVSKFEYKIQDLIIQNLFEIKESGENNLKQYPLIKNIFDLEIQVFKKLIQNKYLNLEYFKGLDPEDYKDRSKTPNLLYMGRFINYSKFRKAIYDFVYKSQRHSIDGNAFYEMVFNGILDDLKSANEYGIKEKLNIWYSLYNFFNPKQSINMINKLKEYQGFVTAIISDEELIEITDEKFAFAAGQVIEYILSKSKSADNSYNLLEPYLQQSKCSEFKKAIANDFGRYKHENFSKNFEKVASFVLSYETDTNLKHLLPQLLSGIFAKNQLFSSTK